MRLCDWIWHDCIAKFRMRPRDHNILDNYPQKLFATTENPNRISKIEQEFCAMPCYLLFRLSTISSLVVPLLLQAILKFVQFSLVQNSTSPRLFE